MAGNKEDEASEAVGKQAKAILMRRMRTEVDNILDRFNAQYLDRWRNPLLRHDHFPRRFTVRTTSGAMEIGVLQAGPSQLGAAAPPKSSTEPAVVTVYLHESFVNNYAAGMLPGRVLTEREMRRQMQGLMGVADKSPSASKQRAGLDSQRWLVES